MDMEVLDTVWTTGGPCGAETSVDALIETNIAFRKWDGTNSEAGIGETEYEEVTGGGTMWEHQCVPSDLELNLYGTFTTYSRDGEFLSRGGRFI